MTRIKHYDLGHTDISSLSMHDLSTEGWWKKIRGLSYREATCSRCGFLSTVPNHIYERKRGLTTIEVVFLAGDFLERINRLFPAAPHSIARSVDYMRSESISALGWHALRGTREKNRMLAKFRVKKDLAIKYQSLHFYQPAYQKTMVILGLRAGSIPSIHKLEVVWVRQNWTYRYPSPLEIICGRTRTYNNAANYFPV